MRVSWIVRAEDAIRALRDVESASIQSEGDTIREIHILSRSNRPPKQIVRDVQTVLQARFNRSIDYRVVSVAYLSDTSGSPRPSAASPVAPAPTREVPPPEPPPAPHSHPVRSEPDPAPVHERVAEPVHERAPQREAEPVRAPAPRNSQEAPPPPRSAEGERIRFGSVNLFVAGPRTQAQVELKWHGLPRMGSASGWSTRANVHRLVAQAAVAAVQEFLAEEVALGAQDVEFLKLGRGRCVVVSLSLLAGRQEKILVGTCAVEQDVQQAVVCATLDALNRVVAGLRPLEPTEYVVRPTSDSRRERSE
jgi:outer membrane biosynthesis protein TonB